MDEQKQNLEGTKDIPTGWKNAPKLADLKQNLTDATPVHQEQVAKVKDWLDQLHVRNGAKVKVGKNRSAIVPKLIRKHAEWRYPALSDPFLSAQDMFRVSPYTAEDRDAAKQNQLLLNQQFNTRMNKVSFIDEYVRAAVEEGTVIIKTGWNFKEEEYEDEEPVVQFVPDLAFEATIQQLMQLQQDSPSLFQTNVPEELKQALEISAQEGVPYRPEVIGYKPVKKKRTVLNHPTAEICTLESVILDPSAQGDIKKAGFVIHTFEASMSELKADGRYENLDLINTANANILAQPDSAVADSVNNFNFKDEPRKKFLVHEYWGFWDVDGEGLVKPIVAAWVGDQIIRMEDNPFPDKEVPFILVSYLPIRKSNYGEPDGALLEDNQKIVGATTRGMIDVMAKSANGQLGMAKNFLDVTNRRKYEAGLDYEFNPGTNPVEGVYVHKYQEIPQAAQFMLALQQSEAESLTGVKAFNSGVSGDSLGEVAAGVRGALDAASKRELSILRRLSQGIVAMGRKFISMNAEFLSPEETIRITDEEFVDIRRDDLQGNFDLRLSITTAEEDNAKAQELSFMLQTMGNNMDPEMSKMILVDIALLRKMPDLARKLQDYQPQPDPVQQELQMLQVELLKAQIANQQAQAIERQTQAQLNTSKAGTEEAKAGLIQSDTDNNNLNFIQEESGVNHARARELHGEQARSQAKLKELESGERQLDRDYDLVKEYMKTLNKPPRIK